METPFQGRAGVPARLPGLLLQLVARYHGTREDAVIVDQVHACAHPLASQSAIPQVRATSTLSADHPFFPGNLSRLGGGGRFLHSFFSAIWPSVA